MNKQWTQTRKKIKEKKDSPVRNLSVNSSIAGVLAYELNGESKMYSEITLQ